MFDHVIAKQYCLYATWPATRDSPAEYCPEPAEPGAEYCALHDPDNWQPDWDDRRKDQLIGYDCE